MNPCALELVQFLRGFAGTGWQDYVFTPQGLDLDTLTVETLTAPLPSIDRTAHGFQDFAPVGQAAVTPGDPALSLVFHAFASPRVHPTADGAPGDQLAYLSLEELDALENMIYALDERTLEWEALELAVFAYEYRPAPATSHRLHADFVYSRTGLARVGDQPFAFNPSARNFSGGAVAAVAPSRFGLFLAERRSFSKGELSLRGHSDSDDAGRAFLYPVRKVFPGSHCLAGCKLSIEFKESHRAEKLSRIISQGKFKIPLGLDASAPSFLRTSPDPELVILRPVGATALVYPPPAALVRLARQANGVSGRTEVARFKVTPLKTALPFFQNVSFLWLNRHSTSLMILSNVFLAALEGLSIKYGWFAWLLQKLGCWPVQRPRNCPEFVNIRHEVELDGVTVRDLNDLPVGKLNERVNRGGYWAAMFEDGTCDGAVYAVLKGFGPPRLSLAAFSVISAPDFFPNADSADLQNWFDGTGLAADQQFKEGSPRPLCDGRYAVNPAPVIALDGGAPQAAFPETEKTMTAIVGRPAPSASGGAQLTPVPLADARANAPTWMPDGASDEFAPGWDITFSSGREGSVYTTYGLGSPYPEDVKFCAAANAYWPAATPDAARTFERDDPPSALPMLDEELGYHPQNEAVLAGRAVPQPGWDGEYGPFFQLCPTGRLGINYADLDHTDYVRNTLRGTFAARVFGAVTSDVLIERMECLRRCIAVLPAEPQKIVSKTKWWLVRAEAVKDWAAAGDPTLRGRGYPFVFALAIPVSMQKAALVGCRLWREIEGRPRFCPVTMDGVGVADSETGPFAYV